MSDHHNSNEKMNTNNAGRSVTQRIKQSVCMYASQFLPDNTSSDSDYSDNTSEISTHDEHSHETIAISSIEGPPNESLNYTNYLHLNELLNGVHCLSHRDPYDVNTPHVHDEHFFIIVHQIFELWFKAFLFEINSIQEIFSDPKQVESQLFHINLRLQRSVGIWNMSINMLQSLQTMTPVEFLAFRDYITPASGFQSLQFRLIETKLGLTDETRDAYKMKYFTNTMFKGQQSDELKKAIEEDSLLILLERWLEYTYDTKKPDFLKQFTTAVNCFIEHTKEQKIVNNVDEETIQRETNRVKEQFANMLNEDEYNKLRDTKVRRMSHKAMLAAVMISLYHYQPCFQQSYQMLNLLMDIDSLMASWRHKHVLLVQRQIGRKPGTGGTDGFSYLHKTISEKYQVFIDLFNVSSYLIPQQFLPKIIEPTNSIWSPDL